MARVLDTNQAGSVSDVLRTALDEAGYSMEESIPGLIQAVVDLARGDEQVLDEAANLLADGGV